MKYITLLTILLLSGCTALNNKATITTTTNSVTFQTDRPTEMSMEKDGKIYKYNSQAPSLLSRIMSGMALGLTGTRR